MNHIVYVILPIAMLFSCMEVHAQQAEPWQKAYVGEDAAGAHVIAFWNFDETGDVVADVSGKGHDGVLSGVLRLPDGLFGGCIQSFPGWPVEDVKHAVTVPNAPDLSPRQGFTLEMWICPDVPPEGYGEAFLLDKKYVDHTDYQWILEALDNQGKQRMRAVLGFGGDSDTWWSEESLQLPAGQWSHIALTYDGKGAVEFFQDGCSLGGECKPARGSICPGNQALSIGDRIGSYYHGFPGRMDEVRITADAREFRPMTVVQEHIRTVYRRMEPNATLEFSLRNNQREAISGMEACIVIPGTPEQVFSVEEIAPGETHRLEYILDTRLRPDTYPVMARCAFSVGSNAYSNQERFEVRLIGRKTPHRMPVVMWGIGGTEAVLENMDPLKDIGFTHCLGLRCDYQKIWEAESPIQAVSDAELAESYRMLNEALAHDLGIVISLSPGHWLESNSDTLRQDALGNPYDRPNICCNFPGIQRFAERVGASVAQTFGAFPALDGALLHSEVRDGTQLCFHEHDKALYHSATGKTYPEDAGTKQGLAYDKIAGFPADRIVPDDYDLLQFYRWFWHEGDGWNGLHSCMHRGLKSTGRNDLWTFFDPAVRVPPLWGSGGDVDFLSHWTYSYPDPIRIGLCTDELFAMAQGGPEGQGVMKMTQIIWYRSQTAPAEESENPSSAKSPWEDYDPGADYITISPMHLREAFWTKISRPIKGIMYHGWQSLVPTQGPSVYRFTHPETQHALKDLIASVVEPLGPMLLQAPGTPSDVAFLESFASAMFAGRGTYGWGGSWAGDAYHVLTYAHLQPDIVYEEAILDHGLEGRKVLVLMDCDVLTHSAAARILEFQRAGGLLVGDERLCPAIAPDILLRSCARTQQADADKTLLMNMAAELSAQLEGRYQPYLTSSVPDVISYRRKYNSSDYIFAVNDRREFGSYVGRHGLVMEQGLPASAVLTVQRPGGQVYDLVQHRKIASEEVQNKLCIPVDLEPGGGRIFLVTENSIERVSVQAVDEARRTEEMPIQIAVLDEHDRPMDAVIPMEVRILDPDGRVSELSGYYGAVGGQQDIAYSFAPNDTLGMWTIEATELASGIVARRYIRVIE